MNNFLEEIRRSKDNGAKMLNYNTDPDSSSSSNNPQDKNSKKPSLSSLFRRNMKTEKIDVKESEFSISLEDNNISKENEIFETAMSVIDIENSILENDFEIRRTDIQKTSEEQNNTTIKDESIDIVNDNDADANIDEDDDNIFSFDEDFMKKYYYDDISSQSENSSDCSDKSIEENPFSTTDNPPVDNIETNVKIAESDTLKNSFEEIDTDIILGDTSKNDTDIIVEEESSLPSTPLLNEKNTDNASINNDVSISDVKVDKIESIVCIQIGNNSSKLSEMEGFVNIPLTVTVKPVEPDTPPKRKRGRPRKNKT